MGDITNADYAHAERVCKNFNNTLLLGDIFENFRNMCIKIYELDPENFFQHLD